MSLKDTMGNLEKILKSWSYVWMFFLTLGLITLVILTFSQALRQAHKNYQQQSCQALAPDEDFRTTVRDIPTFLLPDSTGKLIASEKLAGQAIFLHFWQSDCSPCQTEKASLQKLATTLGNANFTMIAISEDGSWSKAQSFFSPGSSIKVLLDSYDDKSLGFGRVGTNYKISGYPETFLIDAKGRFRYFFRSPRQWDSKEAIRCMKSLME